MYGNICGKLSLISKNECVSVFVSCLAHKLDWRYRTKLYRVVWIIDSVLFGYIEALAVILGGSILYLSTNNSATFP